MNDIELLKKYFLAIKLYNQIQEARRFEMKQIKKICKEFKIDSIYD